MAITYIMDKRFARTILQSIIDERKEVREKSVIQLEALNLGACSLEKAVASGAVLQHEAGILRYHANYKGAYMFQDERTRGALKAAVARLEHDIALDDERAAREAERAAAEAARDE